MDLFNPYPNYNLTKMKYELDVSNMDNPYVQVLWEDFPENFTQEKIKSVKAYFQTKYGTTSVNVITKTKLSDDVTSNVDISFNLLDDNFQIKLIDEFLKNKGNDELRDEILSLNTFVDNQLKSGEDEVTPFKRWFIKNIEFSNFLSYGDNQKIDFEKCNGITIVESNPSNFGGKTILTVDLLLFLFFNETTKTSKAEEIFNRFTDKNKVLVKGEIIIDGDEYIITRVIQRKLSKKGEWNVKTELDFFKKLADGSILNFTGEQRRETESFIKRSIGSKEDFLMTILTTASNLEELIDSKPTARGLVLSRFMGLDYLKRKEEIGKSKYSEFSKSMMSNIYSSEQLKNDNHTYEGQIKEYRTTLETLNTNLIESQNRIINGQNYRDELLRSKFNDIDVEMSNLVPTKVQEEINGYNYEKLQLIENINSVNVVEPSEFYHEDKHDQVKEEIRNITKEITEVNFTIKSIEELKQSVNGGIKCEHCGIELMNAEITQRKISELAGYIEHKGGLDGLMNELTGKELSFVNLKKEFDIYEKNKLIKEKYEVSLESVNLKIINLREKLKKFYDIQDKITKNNEIDGKIIKANLLMDSLEREKTTINNNIVTSQNTIQNLNDKIIHNTNTIEKIIKEAHQEKIYKIYLEVFGKNGISKMIMKTMMPLINSELQRLLENSSHFRLEVRINDKNEVEFIMIDNNTQVEKDMVSGSGFERTIASLALRSVLSKICSLPKPNIIVFDETFGKVSNENLEMVGDFFSKIKEYFEKIFIITHNPLVSNWADSVVKIKKENNISYVKQ
jgi:DNA repair exonuclease SbcCD ATPase subunit